MKTLQAGDKAPQFSLQNQNDETVSLADFAGKKVLVYFMQKQLNQDAQYKPRAYAI